MIYPLWFEFKGIRDVLNVENQSTRIEYHGEDGDTSGGSGLCDELFDDVEVQNKEEKLQERSNEVD